MDADQHRRASDVAAASLNTRDLIRLRNTNGYFNQALRVAAAHFALLVDVLATEAIEIEAQHEAMKATLMWGPVDDPGVPQQREPEAGS